MIERITINNFKSIKQAEVKLQKINLLIGPNNSGKSNFLKAFSFISTKLRLENENQNLLRWNYAENKENEKTTISLILDNGFYSFGFDDLVKFSNFEAVNKYLSPLIYKIDINKISYPYPLIADEYIVDGDASNISSFLQYLNNQEKKLFSSIVSSLHGLTPIFDELILRTEKPLEDNIYLSEETKERTFVQFGLKDNSANKYWAEELSDGVIYLVAILCIINQPKPPKLLLIEEPELGIHPRRIKEIIDLIRKLSSERGIQIVMTTHSPLIVDLFEDNPESIFVFEMNNEGFTSIRNLKADIIDPINKELKEKGLEPNKDYETTLGQQWVYGFLGGVPI